MLRLLIATVVTATVPFVPNDPGYGPNVAALGAMSVPQAWSLTQGDPAIVIAVIDSGTASNPDFDFVPGRNILDDSASTPDQNGHGTAMAAIAAAQIDNGIGVAGICGKCRIMSVKISGADDRHLNSDLAAGINWAVDHGADVIAVTSCGDPPPHAALARAAAHGIRVFICPSEARAFDNAAYAGIAGLMLSCNPVLSPTEITQILIRSSANGVVNAYRSVVLAGCRANAAEIVRLMVTVHGRGTVTRSPDDDTYNAGTVVVLRATARPRWRFAHWGGVCHGHRATCTLRLTQSGFATAYFRRR